MAHAFFLGVDLEEDDGSVEAALTVVEKEAQANASSRFRLDHARRRSLESPDALADQLQSLVAERPYTGRTNIVINQSAEPGSALVDALTNRGLDPIAVALTGGSNAGPGGSEEVDISLGVADAVRTLAELYRDGHLAIESHTTEAASSLARGVQRAVEVLDAADGNQDTPEAAGSTLDALNDADPHLTSAALAVWCGTERSFDPSQHLKADPHTRRPDGDEAA